MPERGRTIIGANTASNLDHLFMNSANSLHNPVTIGSNYLSEVQAN
jgi:hypothetical protein